MTTTSPTPAESQHPSLRMALLVIAVGVFATTMSQVESLAALPLRNLLKNGLHLDRAGNAAFFFWSGIAWYFKPLAGILTDAVPLFGSRRRSYILVCASLGVVSWIGLIFTPHDYNPLLWMCILINVFMVVTSTVVGAYMVEIAQMSGGSGRLTSVRQTVYYACILISSPLSGVMASIAFGWTAAACGGVLFLIVPVAFFALRERDVDLSSQASLGVATGQLRTIAQARTMWAATGLLALFYLAPGVTTALFYRQQNELHMTTQFQGFLGLLAGAGGVVAALCYGRLCRRFNLKALLVVSLAGSAAVSSTYVFYTSAFNAQIIDTVNGFAFAMAEIALMDLAVRATPRGSEGLGFSLMLSVRNLAVFGADWAGSAAMDKLHVSFDALVVANALTTLITVPIIFVLPRVLVLHKDAEAPDVAAMPKSMIQA